MRCLNCGCNGIPLDAVNCPNCGVHLATLMRDCLSSGTLLQNTYRIDYPLGRGGFGITYRAFDTSLDIPVAIKEFYPHEHAFRENKTGKLIVHLTKQDAYQRSLERFRQEGKTLARLRHESLVTVHASFHGRETAYLVMELVDGVTLRDQLNKQPAQSLTIDQALPIMSSLIEALSVAHQQQIYHLDIAPDNVMVTPDNRVVLIDFGASRQGLGSSRTQAYKDAYAPTEVIKGEGLGAWSDVFELGMMFYEMLTGTLPPKALHRITEGSDGWTPSHLPEPWRGLIASAVRLDPKTRPQTVQDWWNSSSLPPWTIPSKPSDFLPPTTPSPLPPVPTSPVSTPPVLPLLEPPSPAPINAPAGFALRLMADIIDRLLLILASAMFHLTQRLAAEDASTYTAQLFCAYIVLAFVYGPVMESSAVQGTVGKLLVGIKVTDLRGQKIQLGRAYNRHICKIFSYLSLFIGFFMAGFTENKQAMHDRIAKCLVLKRT